MCLVAILLIFVSQTSFLEAADPIVELPTGYIQGREAATLANTTYYAFQGVPYALPPIDSLRFQPPQAHYGWDAIWDATSFNTICFQASINNELESEDCLYLNVYTPELPSNESNVSLPVMLYIHGGAFVDGSGDWVAPDLFINQNVVVVTINYRLGIFGFLSTQDEVIPGNNGLKDQQFALQWTNENIHLFGGNPNLVTIFGISAGSASCAYQLLNPSNEGLFKGAILGSGSFLSPWAFQRRSKEIAFKTASFLDPRFENNTNSQDLLDFLLTVDARDIDAAAESFHDSERGPQDLEELQGYYFSPVVEVPNESAFLTSKMYGLLRSESVVRVPIIIGTTSEESLSFAESPDAFRQLLQVFDENIGWIVPNDMMITDSEELILMGIKIRDLYTNGEPLVDHLGDAVRFGTDTAFARSIRKHAELSSGLVDTYFYVFSYDGLIGNSDIHYDGAENVTHGEDYNYLFCSGDECDDSGFPESDRVTRQRLILLWSNFAKYQNPSPEPSDILQQVSWPAVATSGDFYYLDIGENLTLKTNPRQETYHVWNNLYGSLNYTDFDTY